MELKDTVEAMCSEDYKERLAAEYYQLKIRYKKLKAFCCRIEAAEMTGIAITDWESAEKAAAAIAESGPGNVLITMGEAGALLYSDGETVRVPSVKTEAVDPTAAGDSFVGAFCAAYAAGLAPDDSMTFASHAASLTVSGYGAQPSIPDISRIIERLGETASRFDRDALSRLTGVN